ncbi:M23 family metallopeptidase [Mycobacterium barrassiae]|nr:M23 family metallopeptidase [Mycobacterium barrassiae]
MVSHRLTARSNAPREHLWDADVTEIIPVNEFSPAADSTVNRSPFATDVEVLTAPELDDLNDLTDEWPLLLLAPTRASRSPRPASTGPSRVYVQEAGQRATSAGAHRRIPATHRRTPAGAGSVHGRLVVAGVAAGAIAAGANAMVEASEVPANPTLIADATTAQGDSVPDAAGVQIVQVANSFDSAVHQEELVRGAAFAQERAQREARMRRPQFVFPARGILTSGFGTRWGSLHAGLDIANAVGTPIYAASDGEVVASGPTPGYGMWVKIRASDGTVTLYGHIDTATVQEGDRVLAGDQIATMGNRGNSTGPHLHFEVHRNGSDKIDPMAWLQERGVPRQ